MTVRGRSKGTLLAAGLAAAALFAGCAPGGTTPDGKHVFFETVDPLGNADNDSARDVYERFNGRTTLISQGPFDDPADPGAQFRGSSTDGKRVFFTTNERLVEADGDDGFTDIYMRAGDKTKLISRGQISDYYNNPVTFGEASPDGRTVAFTTNVKLTTGDLDGGMASVYVRRGNKTRLASPSFIGVNSSFADLVDGGDMVIIETDIAYFSEDGDGENVDVYSWRDGEYELISQGADENYATESHATYEGASADGDRIFFRTQASLDDADADPDAPDIYQRRGSNTRLISGGANGDFNAEAAAVSRDGTRVAIETRDALTGQDDDGTQLDVYVSTNGTPRLASRGPVADNQAFDAFFGGASADLGTVAWETQESLISRDEEANYDVYARRGSDTALISQGPAGNNDNQDARIEGISTDGRTIFFNTDEILVDADTDFHADVYRRKGSKTTLISRGPGTAGNAGFDAGFLFASDDGGRAFFYTGEQLVPADEEPSGACDDDDDPACSGYERFRSKTKLVDQGN